MGLSRTGPQSGSLGQVTDVNHCLHAACPGLAEVADVVDIIAGVGDHPEVHLPGIYRGRLGSLDHREFPPLPPLHRRLRPPRLPGWLACLTSVPGDDDVDVTVAGPEHQSRLVHADSPQAASVHVDQFVSLEEPSVPANISGYYRILAQSVLRLTNEKLITL